MKMFAVRDVKSEGFMTPFFQPTFGLAERMFKEAANDEKSMICKNPEDFSLYYLGEFNNASGELKSEKPKHISDATAQKSPA